MSFFDSHTHIQSREFDTDRSEMIERARNAGVSGMLVLGWDVPSSAAAVELADAEAGVLAAAGCHPHDARSMDDASLAALATLARDPRVTAVGEIGLDFYRDLSPRDKQMDVFQRQLETAREVEKPVAIHCRNAVEVLFPIVETWAAGRHQLPDGRPLGVMHYFSEDPELASRYVEMGFLISVHCSVTYPKATQLQEVARRVPLESLVVETDSPYGPPQSHRGKRNEPAYVAEAVAKLAELRGEAVERVAAATEANALRLLTVAGEAATAKSRARQRV